MAERCGIARTVPGVFGAAAASFSRRVVRLDVLVTPDHDAPHRNDARLRRVVVAPRSARAHHASGPSLRQTERWFNKNDAGEGSAQPREAAVKQNEGNSEQRAPKTITLGRRGVLTGAGAALSGIASTGAARAAQAVPQGKLVLAWHTNIAARWLDPQQHDGTASPDNFLMAIHDGLIKNFREVRYNHPALAERYEFAEDAKSATFWLRPGIRFHDGTPVTPADVKWSYQHYRGAWGEVLREKTQDIELPDDHTIRFHFKEPFLDFPILLGNRQRVRRRLGSSGEILRTDRTGQLPAEADRRRSLQAGLPAAGREARVRGVRRLLPPGPHQAVDDGQRAGGSDARRHAGARRG
jgi:hypothetical protein